MSTLAVRKTAKVPGKCLMFRETAQFLTLTTRNSENPGPAHAHRKRTLSIARSGRNRSGTGAAAWVSSRAVAFSPLICGRARFFARGPLDSYKSYTAVAQKSGAQARGDMD